MTPDATRSAGRARITDPRAPRRWVVPLAIVVLVLGTLGAGAWLLGLTEGAVNRTALADEPKGVTVTPARAAQYRATRRYVGTLEPWQEARIGPQLASGFVDTVLVRPGAFAKRGDVLATLDCRNASAASSVIGYQARALEARQKATAREAARLNELLDGGFAAPNEVEQKLAQSAAHEAQIQALLAQASGKSLEVRDCVLRAPFDGEVAARFADPGTFVRPGTPIVQLVDRSVVRLTAFVPEIDFDVVPPRTNVKLRVRATGKELTGEIARRSPAADTSTRTVRVEIDLASATRELPVGTTAEITVDVGAPVDAIEVPLVAAQIRGKRAALFVIEGSTAKKVTVDVLGERDGSLFVGTALAPDTHVVTQGRSLLAEGDRVTTKVDGPPSGRDGGAPATPTSAGERAEPPPERPSRSGPP
ncbi:MAG: efflux RND transporter periplasmic adaptor subunit [Labilithrix sp.]|nr:efflux RND transporter periplasmic adaptor subunit [Labilithrix sp.]